ncbi:Follicle cell protein 3C-1 [Pseudolycoriella hygida]|uniref:Follicle cell protein 3C-1 n=1 Tax=Pseudolycoriella hygida TaxID=35572 RepID=A0A9Q0RUL6_9DIPT|nr:Follicle cell protein 3C-1 [Pseudolycoriella hygida]
MAKMQFNSVMVLVACALFFNLCESSQPLKTNIENAFAKLHKTNAVKEQLPCTCGVFLTGQFKRGSSEPPKGNPALMHEQELQFSCNAAGVKQCTNRCLEMIVKHLSNSPAIVCGLIDRDCYKERAYLFVQNCNSTWINTNLSAGREYCCKDGLPYKCPLV